MDLNQYLDRMSIKTTIIRIHDVGKAYIRLLDDRRPLFLVYFWMFYVAFWAVFRARILELSLNYTCAMSFLHVLPQFTQFYHLGWW